MKKLSVLLVVCMLMSMVSQAVIASKGDTSEPVKRVDEEITDSLYNSRISGNLFLYLNSPRTRFGTEILQIDEDDKSVTPQMIGNSLMLPADFLAKVLGAEYSGDTQNAVISIGDTEISFECGKAEYSLSGALSALSDAPVESLGHLYIPLRATFEAFGKEVHWDKCGIIIAGDSADSFSWDEKTGYEIMLRATRDILYESPSPDDVVKLLKDQNPDNEHPRLLLRQDDIPVLRDKVNKSEPYKSWYAEVKKFADLYLDYTDEQLNLSYVLEDGLRLLYVSRRAATYIEALSFTYLMTGDEKYAKKAIKVMMKVCGDDFPDWHPYHFLDVAEMAAAVALGYDWCYDVMRPSQKWVAKNALVEKALKPVMEDYNEVPGRSRTWYWSSSSSSAYPQNWVSVCFGGTTMAALAIGDEDLGDFTEVGNVITEGMERQKDLYDTYMPDGAFIDGPGYWEFAMNYLTFALASMKTSLGTEYSMTNCPGIISTFDWLAQLMGSDGGFNFDSNSPEYTNSPEYFWFSEILNRPELSGYRMETQLDKWNLSPSFKDILWYQSDDTDSELNLDTAYSSRGGISMAALRSGFDDMDTWVSVFGSYMDKHVGTSQMFDGSFVMDMLGTRFAMDLGSEWGTYSQSIWRGNFYKFRAEGHNTVIIQPGEGYDQDPYARAVLERLETGVNSSLVIYNLTEQLAYKGAKSWRRGIRLNRDTNRVIVQDELSAKKDIEYYWFMHTEADIDVFEDGRTAILSRNNRKIMAKLVSDDKSLKFSVMDALPLETSPHPEVQDSTEGIRKLTVHSPAIRDVAMAVEFIPLFGDETAESDYKYIGLDNWNFDSEIKFDKSLQINNLTIDGAPVAGFDPENRYYSKELGLSGVDVMPRIDAETNVGEISFTPPTNDNYVGRITVTNPSDPTLYNEYYVDFYLKDFSDAMITMRTPEIVDYGLEPKGLKRIDVASVDAPYIPQESNPPKAMVDSSLSTRYSVDKLGTTVDFDLGSEQTVTHIGTGVYDGRKRGMMYTLASSDDGINWKEVISVRTSGTTDDLEVYEIPETTARYFRMYCCGNTNDGSRDGVWFSVTEMAFFTNKQ